jgi:oligopeptide transport system ATP-binding protein
MTAITKATAPAALEIVNLEMKFPLHSALLRRILGWVQAVRGVSFTIAQGESFGVVGESGCGKSTLAECIVRLARPTAGQIIFEGADVTHLKGSALRRFRRDVQIVSQDPFESLNPRMTVRQLLLEPLQIHNIGAPAERHERVEELCEAVGIDVSLIDRRPTTFSGGQRQRIAIARALAPRPKLLVLDEPVSALDTSVQAQILNLLNDLRKRLGVSYVFIGHDLAVVRQVCDRIGVMYLGKIVEVGDAETLLQHPVHPYTHTLLRAAGALEPGSDIDLDASVDTTGEVPSPRNPPSGCGFRTRCSRADELCAAVTPELRTFDALHTAACHHPLVPGETSAPSRNQEAGIDRLTRVGQTEPE